MAETFAEVSDGNLTSHLLGALAGTDLWLEAVPCSDLSARLPARTPVGGLLLAGHWTQPAHGIFAVVESGIQAARLALGAPTAAPPLPVGLK